MPTECLLVIEWAAEASQTGRLTSLSSTSYDGTAMYCMWVSMEGPELSIKPSPIRKPAHVPLSGIHTGVIHIFENQDYGGGHQKSLDPPPGRAFKVFSEQDR